MSECRGDQDALWDSQSPHAFALVTALCSSVRPAPGLRSLRHCGGTPAATPTGGRSASLRPPCLAERTAPYWSGSLAELVRSITIRRISAFLTSTEPYLLVFCQGELYRCTISSLVGIVAKGLVIGSTTGTPQVITGRQTGAVWHIARDLRLAHRQYSNRMRWNGLLIQQQFSSNRDSLAPPLHLSRT